MAAHPYKYTFLQASLAAAASASPTVQIDKLVKSFTCTGISALVLEATTGLPISSEQLPLITANLRQESGGVALCNVATPLYLFSGNGREPHLLDKPFVLKGNSTPELELNNISTDKTYKVYVTLHGYRDKD